ncbi:hypothetical protein TNIN_64631 [Trichonephila inaurata madagascariensis]|uniref:Uncharacterized protein n=1 Tax=Trichonephila inaurata madagascariensis TaxID=2747483 RepID=A0A8X7C006_9ARAC|nr:hypothetical protein TNIN_64631 [Trichonephila inaurata madagascariensis]
MTNDSETYYPDIFDDKDDDSDNESFSTINSDEYELDHLDDARKWIKLSSDHENISAAPPRFSFTGTKRTFP